MAGTIQWFPGHMAKTRRMIASNLSLVDGVIEILDARAPRSSRNPDMDGIIGKKPRLFLLNKADLADPNATNAWICSYEKDSLLALGADCRSGKGLGQIPRVVREKLLPALLQRRAARGLSGQAVRLMVVGIPNVGKSSFINRMAKSKRAKVEDRPGVTRQKKWVKIAENMELLDMPGVLWPKFDDQSAARRLAFTGAISDDTMDIEALACELLEYLSENYSAALTARYRLSSEDFAEKGHIQLEQLSKNRGMLLQGGAPDTARAAAALLDEYRAGKLGRITLELP